MPTYSQTDWAARALQRAAIVAGDETPSADLSDWAVEVGASLFAQLETEGVKFTNGNDMALPGEYFQIFSSLVACDLKSEVGLMGEVEAEAAKVEIKKTLRRMNAKQATGVVVQAQYF